MFSIFKPKSPILKDLLVGYTDIHSHILFGIDDGAENKENSEFLMNSFIDFGFKNAIATPHTIKDVWDNTSEGITNKYKEVQQVLPELSSKLNLRVASEYLMDDSFMQLFQSEKLLTLKDDYVLVEMSYVNPPIQLYDILFELQMAGYKPVLAHPERYLFYHFDFNQYEKLKTAGCVFQMNLLSAVGYYGPSVAKVVDRLLSDGMIDFVGTDAHHEKHIKAFEGRVLVKNLNPLKEAIKNNSFFEK